MIIKFLSPAESLALRRVPDELALIRVELSGLRAAAERIATALERQPDPRVPASVVWHVAAPQEE